MVQALDIGLGTRWIGKAARETSARPLRLGETRNQIPWSIRTIACHSSRHGAPLGLLKSHRRGGQDGGDAEQQSNREGEHDGLADP